MKKQTAFLLIIGGLCLGISLFVRRFFTIAEDPADFIIGLGAAFLISALFVQRKLKNAEDML